MWLHGSPRNTVGALVGENEGVNGDYQRSQENTKTQDDIKSFAPLLGVDALPQLLVHSNIILHLPYKI